jgi:N-acetylneuraminic acid mutarotase
MSVVLFSCGNSSNNNNGDWVTKAVFHGANRIGAVGFVVGDTGYVSTGFDGINYYNDLWAYDTTGNAWTQRDSFPGPKRALGVAFATTSYGYVGAGYNGSGVTVSGATQYYLSDFYKYDPTTNSWTQIGSLPLTQGSPGLRYAVAFGIGGTYNIGGVVGGTDGQFNYNTYYKYTESSNTWTADNTYPGPKRTGSVAWVYQNRAYIVTGLGDNNANLTDFWVYDPSLTGSAQWYQKRRISGVTDQSYDAGYRIVRTNAVAWQQDNAGIPKAYITFGSNGGSLVDCWEYDFATDLWTQKNNFPPGGGRVGAIALTIDGQGFVGLGGTSLSSGAGGTYYSDWTAFLPNTPYNQDDYYAQ